MSILLLMPTTNHNIHAYIDKYMAIKFHFGLMQSMSIFLGIKKIYIALI